MIPAILPHAGIPRIHLQAASARFEKQTKQAVATRKWPPDYDGDPHMERRDAFWRKLNHLRKAHDRL